MGAKEEKTLVQEVNEWLATLPKWQLKIARILREQDEVSDEVRDEIVDLVGTHTYEEEENAPVVELADVDLDHNEVRVLSISGVENVNALLNDGELTFNEDGLTVVYGLNGSGKSGYARILKKVVRARDTPEILPNVFDESGQPPNARIGYKIGESEHTAQLADGPNPLLESVGFFDEHCGDDYLLKDGEISYRPTPIIFLETLAFEVSLVSDALERKARDLDEEMPDLGEDLTSTKCQEFIDSVRSADSLEIVDAFYQGTDSWGPNKNAAVKERARLEASSPEREAKRLLQVHATIESFKDILEEGLTELSEESLKRLARSRENISILEQNLKERRASYESSERGHGVGTVSWRRMWSSAKDFHAEGHPAAEAFPAGGSLTCPLCTQPVPADVRAWLEELDEVFSGTIQRKIDVLVKSANGTHEKLEGLRFDLGTCLEAMRELSPDDSSLLESVRGIHAYVENVVRDLDCDRLPTYSSDGYAAIKRVSADLSDPIIDAIEERAQSIDKDSFNQLIEDARSVETEATELFELLGRRAQIVDYIKRSIRLRRIREAVKGSSTTRYSRKIGELTEKYVTKQMVDQFQLEIKHLGVKNVSFTKSKAVKGKVLHRTTLTGLSGSGSTPALVESVLSEGEKKAAGLAGFLTEFCMPPASSTLIFDDPMSSMDQGRRKKVAERLVDLSQDRQVIVFTHDSVFLADIKRSAKSRSVSVAERCIARDPCLDRPGLVQLELPWGVQDVRARVNELKQRFEALKRLTRAASAGQAPLALEVYEQRLRDILGGMSETWERAIRNGVAFSIIDRSTSDVTANVAVKLLRQWTSFDTEEFNDGYSFVSAYAPRHDIREEAIHLPALDDVEHELDRLSDWVDRVKRYRS